MAARKQKKMKWLKTLFADLDFAGSRKFAAHTHHRIQYSIWIFTWIEGICVCEIRIRQSPTEYKTEATEEEKKTNMLANRIYNQPYIEWAQAISWQWRQHTETAKINHIVCECEWIAQETKVYTD